MLLRESPAKFFACFAVLAAAFALPLQVVLAQSGNYSGADSGFGGPEYSQSSAPAAASPPDDNSASQGNYAGARGEDSGAQPQYPGTRGEDSGAQPQYAGARGEDSGAQPQYPGARGEYGGSQPQYPGARGEDSGAQPQYPGPRGEYGGSQPQYPGARGQYQDARFGSAMSGWGRPSQYGSSGTYGMPVSGYQSAAGASNGGIISSLIPARALPEGLVLTFQLVGSIDLEKIKEGDYVQGCTSQNYSAGGAAYLPTGSVFSGAVVQDSRDDDHFRHAGKLSVNFEQVRLPRGVVIPVRAHLLGSIGRYYYQGTGSNSPRGVRQGVNYGLGSIAGSAFGPSYGIGGGGNPLAYGGALMYSSTYLVSRLFMNRHQDSYLPGGCTMQLQLDEPLELPGLADAEGRYSVQREIR